MDILNVFSGFLLASQFNKELSVVGVGTVRIQMYDGVVRTLEVRHSACG